MLSITLHHNYVIMGQWHVVDWRQCAGLVYGYLWDWVKAMSGTGLRQCERLDYGNVRDWIRGGGSRPETTKI